MSVVYLACAHCLLSQVGRALLKPVEKLLRSDGGSNRQPPQDPTDPTDGAASGAAGTPLPTSGTQTPSLARGSARMIPPEREEHESLEDNQAARRNLEEGGRGRGAAYAALFGGGAAAAGGGFGGADTEPVTPTAGTLERNETGGVGGEEGEGRGRGQGAFAGLLAAGAADDGQLQAAGGVASGVDGAAAGHGAGTQAGAAVAAVAGAGGEGGAAGAPARPMALDNDVLQPAAELLAIRTVKAHKQPTNQAPEPAGSSTVTAADGAADDTQNSIAAQLARLNEPGAGKTLTGAQAGAGTDPSLPNTGPQQAAPSEGTVSKGMLYSVLASLMGGPAQVAEFEGVMQKLQYDKHQELSFEQISEGLKYLGEFLAISS